VRAAWRKENEKNGNTGGTPTDDPVELAREKKALLPVTPAGPATPTGMRERNWKNRKKG
jgi:hypothetical protein